MIQVKFRYVLNGSFLRGCHKEPSNGTAVSIFEFSGMTCIGKSLMLVTLQGFWLWPRSRWTALDVGATPAFATDPEMPDGPPSVGATLVTSLAKASVWNFESGFSFEENARNPLCETLEADCRLKKMLEIQVARYLTVGLTHTQNNNKRRKGHLQVWGWAERGYLLMRKSSTNNLYIKGKCLVYTWTRYFFNQSFCKNLLFNHSSSSNLRERKIILMNQVSCRKWREEIIKYIWSLYISLILTTTQLLRILA